MNNTNDMEQIDIKRLLEIVLDKFVSIVVVTLIFGVLAFAVSKYFITPQYSSEITMIIDNRKNTTYLNNAMETKTLSSDITAAQLLVPTYVEMIKSRNVLQEVSDSVERKTGKRYSVGALRAMVSARSVSDTEILKVYVKTDNAVMAREIAETIAEIAPNKIQEFVERSDVKIIDHALANNYPVSPNVIKNTLMGFFIGFLLSVVFVLLREFFDVRVKSADDLVVKFNIPVIGTIPEIYVSYDMNEKSDHDYDK